MIKTITTQNFETAVLSSSKPILVDFWMDSCKPCHMLHPILDDLSEEFEDILDIGKIDVNAEYALAAQYKITAVPTMLLFKDGVLINKMIGLLSQQEIEESVMELLGVDHVNPFK